MDDRDARIAELECENARLKLGLRVARRFGIICKSYIPGVAWTVADWVDAGADKPLRHPGDRGFTSWAKEIGAKTTKIGGARYVLPAARAGQERKEQGQ